MRIIDLTELRRRPVDRFASRSFSVAGLGSAHAVHLATARLDAGGVIGRHPAVRRQLLVVVAGECDVSGADGVGSVRIGPGYAVLWDAGEEHETSSESGVLVLIVEGDLDLDHLNLDDLT